MSDNKEISPKALTAEIRLWLTEAWARGYNEGYRHGKEAADLFSTHDRRKDREQRDFSHEAVNRIIVKFPTLSPDKE